MREYLKGNYRLDQPTSATPLPSAPEAAEMEFEAQALLKLGGSIAFVKKSSAFVWDGDKSGDTGRETQ